MANLRFRRTLAITTGVEVMTAGTCVTMTAAVSYTFLPGRPAHTPRGEYAPIDPPEPPEIDVTEVVLMVDGDYDSQRECPQWLQDLIAEDDEVRDDMINHGMAQIYAGADD